jgi:hypothetical protein
VPLVFGRHGGRRFTTERHSAIKQRRGLLGPALRLEAGAQAEHEDDRQGEPSHRAHGRSRLAPAVPILTWITIVPWTMRESVPSGCGEISV